MSRVSTNWMTSPYMQSPRDGTDELGVYADRIPMPHAPTLRWHLHYLPRRIAQRRYRVVHSHVEYLRTWQLLRFRQQYLNLRPNSLTVLITSAGRLACLQQTMESIRDCLNLSGFESVSWMIVDDDPHDRLTREWILASGGFDVVLLLPRSLKLGSALNLALSEVTTEYVFHSEDDWQYMNEIRLSEFAELLGDEVLRPQQVLAYREPIASVAKEYRGAVEIRPGLGRFPRYSFNPHLLRLADYLRWGPVPVFLREEEEYAEKLKALGAGNSLIHSYRRTPLVRHIGYESKLVQGRRWPKPSADWVSSSVR
jgi:hypothetical protein